MALKRMFSRSVLRADGFLDLPASAQMLYVQLCLEADDDGIIDTAKSVMRMVGAGAEDLKCLVEEGFLLYAEPERVYVARHWKVNNQIQKDRYHPSVYKTVTDRLRTLDNKEYVLMDEAQPEKSGPEQPCIQSGYNLDTTCIQNGYNMDTEYRLDKSSEVEDRKGKDSSVQISTAQAREGGSGGNLISRYDWDRMTEQEKNDFLHRNSPQQIQDTLMGFAFARGD